MSPLFAVGGDIVKEIQKFCMICMVPYDQNMINLVRKPGLVIRHLIFINRRRLFCCDCISCIVRLGQSAFSSSFRLYANC